MQKMKKTEFLLLLDRLLGCEPGTLKGPEKLDDIAGWDSLAVVGFIGLADDKFEMVLAPSRLSNCQSIDDLVAVVGEPIETD